MGALVALVLFLSTSGASAATLNVVGGQLLGASGVDVGGILFNAEFRDGSCVDLFNGCDSAADFTFATDVDAFTAGQALLDQVFIDTALGLFDSDPSLTAGCSVSSACGLFTPYGPDTAGFVSVALSSNAPTELFDTTIVQAFDAATDLTAVSSATYVLWAPVPEPSTAILMALGLLAMGVRERRSA